MMIWNRKARIGKARDRRDRGVTRVGWPRRLAGYSVLVLLPLLVLALLEGAVRLAGFGGYPPTFRTVGRLDDGSSLIFSDSAGPATFFFSSRSQGLALDPEPLVMPKPEGTIRVMWVGESAAKGIPQPRNLRGARFLESMLSDLWPGAEVEVINLGVPGIAAYPVLQILIESLDYEPDLVVAYLGNNEFYGAYGVASLHAAGRSPAMIRTTRAVRSLALAQSIDQMLRGRVIVEPESLMEAMVGTSYIGPEDPLRSAAAHNLETFVGAMIDHCRAQDVPIIVCTPPTNESGMSPLGLPDLSHLPPDARAKIRERVAAAAELIDADPEGAESLLRQVLDSCPAHATAHHLLGRALRAQARFAEACQAFRRAVDLDPMPWRPPRSSVQAIRRAVESRGAVLADLEAAFRERSGDGCIGWELIDDHVHPSLEGQVLVARTVVRAMTALEGPLATEPTRLETLPEWREYAARHGATVYDEYAVAHAMRVFGSFSLFNRTNPEMSERNDRTCRRIEEAEHPFVVAQLRRWMEPPSNPGGQLPVTAFVADALYQLGEPWRAYPLFLAAADASMPYSSRRLAFLTFALQSRQEAEGSLDAQDRRLALEAINEARTLIATGGSTSGQAELFAGELHQLRGEDEESIPYLKTARGKLNRGRRVECDEHLVRAYVATGRDAQALAIVTHGLGGPDAEAYRRMRGLIP